MVIKAQATLHFQEGQNLNRGEGQLDQGKSK